MAQPPGWRKTAEAFLKLALRFIPGYKYLLAETAAELLKVHDCGVFMEELKETRRH